MRTIEFKAHAAVLGLLLATLLVVPANADAASDEPSSACGGTLTYGGSTYTTVIIGSQCWLGENLNVGTMIGNLDVPDDIAAIPNDPSTVSKWCFNDALASCEQEGGLYSWAEANALPNFCNSVFCTVPSPNQGICPAGWHVPSDSDFYALENFLTDPGESCSATRASPSGAWDCYPAGGKLRVGGSSGFDAVVAGHHETNGEGSFFDKREPSISFISDFGDPSIQSYSYGRVLYGGADIAYPDTLKVYRGSYLKSFGSPVRCVSDTPVVGPPLDKGQCLKGAWRTFNNPAFKNQGDCVRFLK